MSAAAAAQEFERAAMLRDRLDAVRHVHERQAARIEGGEAFDVIGLHQGEPGANVQVFRVRDGAVVDRQAFYVENAAGREPAEVLEEFLLEFYWDGSTVPPEVVVALEESDGVAALLAARRGAKVIVRAAKRGPKRRLLALAAHNAELAAQAEAERLARRSTARIEALESLRDGLGLEGLPLRIECYDISNLGEQHVVGSMVVFEGGVAKKAHYRKFALRDVQGQDDFAMMNQVLRRRFERRAAAAEDYDESFATLPELVVVDGGKGQLSAAQAALREAGVSVALVSLAKQREEVFVPGRRDPLPLPASDPGSLLLQRIRDEAHRFAVTYHRQRRDADLRKASVFDELPQVGPVRRRRILEHFGSPERFIAASREELERVPGLPRQSGEGDLWAPSQSRLTAPWSAGRPARSGTSPTSAWAGSWSPRDLPLTLDLPRPDSVRGAGPPVESLARPSRTVLRRRARRLRPGRRRLRRRPGLHRLRA